MIGRAVLVSLRLLRLGGRRSAASAALVGIGIVVGTALLTVALGAVHGWEARESRAGWRTEQVEQTSTEPTALLRTSTDAGAGRPVHRVDLASLRPGAAPPGLPRVPGPGDVFVSPALAALMDELPADVLADRYPAATGLISDAGLMGPGELVVVLGRAPAELPDATPVSTFGATAPDVLEAYRRLTSVAAVLVVVPVLSLLGTSARLIATRRTERLATLRVLGASTSQITAVAVAEVTAIAIGAGVLGVAVAWCAAPGLTMLELGGSAWFVDDLRPGMATSIGVVACVAVLAMLAALGGMREIVVGPSGVVRRQRAGSARLLRLLGMVCGLLVFTIIGPVGVAGFAFGAGVLALLGTVSLLGPLVVRILGSWMVRSARSPAGLLAGRRLLDDPRSAFRPLVGLTMAVFVASFLVPLTAAAPVRADHADDTALRIEAAAGHVGELEAAVDNRLAGRGLAAEVSLAEVRGEPGLVVSPTDPVDRDRIRTALGPLVDAPVVTEREAVARTFIMIGDIERGALVVLAGTFVVAATSTGTSVAARILDHRRTLRLLHMAGTPPAVLHAARRAATLRPLLASSAIALGAGLLCAVPFRWVTGGLHPAGLGVLVVALVAGTALVVAASAMSRPVLHAVIAGPAPED